MATGTITIKTNSYKLIPEIMKKPTQAKKVLMATGKDLRKRIPSYVGQEVTEVYNIKKGEIVPGKAGKKMAATIHAEGEIVDDIVISYRGRLLTPTHFSMKPTKRPAAKITTDGKRRKAKPYTVTAEVKKGRRHALGPNVFLGGNGGGGFIPFERMGKARKPIKAVKRVSVAQMVSSKEVEPNLMARISEEITKRIEHNAQRFL